MIETDGGHNAGSVATANWPMLCAASGHRRSDETKRANHRLQPTAATGSCAAAAEMQIVRRREPAITDYLYGRKQDQAHRR